MGVAIFLKKYQWVIVLVLYEDQFSMMPSYTLLTRLLDQETCHLFIYDNSKKKQSDKLFEKTNVSYIHDESNPGLAEAYNAAREYLFTIHADFLILLDQDTVISQAYIEELEQITLNKEVGAIVPVIKSGGKKISPVFNDNYRGRTTVPTNGIYNSLMAINSGTIIPKEILKEIGTFNNQFPLDFLDHWFFWKLNQLGKKVEVLNVILEHDLSVLNYENVSIKRYQSIISSETLFYQQYDTEYFPKYRKHLFFRSIKQFLTVRNRKIWHKTFSVFLSLKEVGE